MKKCSRCKIEKPTTEFYPDLARKDSLNYWCKDCVKKHLKLHKNKEKKYMYDKKWISEHYKAEYWRNKYASDVNYKLLLNLRCRLRDALKGTSQSTRTLKLLDCSVLFFKKYYESKFTEGMSWEKVMSGEIHCDHIKPVAAFDKTEIDWQFKCFHYSNLQPLWAEDNLKKRDKYT
jgi:hypothetical protein